MKVATRITAATAVVVALASASYALIDARARATERHAGIEREARAVASTVRVGLEAQGPAFRVPTESQLRDLGRAAGGWHISVFPRSRAAEVPGPDLSAAQLRRLRTMLDVPQLSFADVDVDSYYLALPIRAVGQATDEQQVTGMLEVSKLVRGPRHADR